MFYYILLYCIIRYTIVIIKELFNVIPNTCGIGKQREVK